MKKRHSVSPTKQAYSKQLKRIKQFIRRAEKRGYIFSENVIPPVPKRITPASVRRLQRITPEKLYKNAAYVSELTLGEIVPANVGLKLEKQKAQEKRKQTLLKKKLKKKKRLKQLGFTNETSSVLLKSDYSKTVVYNFLYTLEKFVNSDGYPVLKDFIDKAIQFNGMDKTAEMIVKVVENEGMIDGQIMYYTTLTNNYISRMLKYLPLDETTKIKLYDSLEDTENFNTYEE